MAGPAYLENLYYMHLILIVYPAKEDLSFYTHLLRYRQRLYLEYPSVMYWRQMTVNSSNKSTKWREDIIHVSICLAKVEVQLCYGKYWKPHTLTVTSLISFILSFHLYIYNERLYILSFYYWKLSTIYCNVNNINYHCSNTHSIMNNRG